MSVAISKHSRLSQPVFVIDGARTPFLKVTGKPGPFSATDLAVAAGQSLLLRQPFKPSDFDEVIMGCITPSENEANIGRLVGLRLGCGDMVPGWTVQRNCGSGMQAIDAGIKDIVTNRAELVLVGGTEAMSRAPLILNSKMVNWLADWRAAKTVSKKLTLLLKLRPDYLAPIVALLRGLTDPLFELSMGQTAEIVANLFHITRQEMDAYALSSHQRLMAAEDRGDLAEIVSIIDREGRIYSSDNGVRRDSSLEKLAALRPVFDRPYGLVTAGNSSQVTDGASMLILASEKAVEKFKLPVMGRIIDVEWAALAPSEMSLGPVYATTPMLLRQQLTLADIEYWEINEAFAVTVLACVKAWQDATFCQQQLGLSESFGKIDLSRLNVDGGAIAIGHPVGASGARIVLHLLSVLKRNNAKRGVAAICIGGGQGGAMLVEREGA